MAEPELLTAEIVSVYQDNITAIKHQLGRPVSIVWEESNSGCPNCYYDGVNKVSAGKYRPGGPTPFTTGTCPTCSGHGVIITHASLTNSGNIFYPALMSSDREQVPGGMFDEAGVNVSFLLSECYINSGQHSGKLAFDVYKYLVLDGQKWVLDGMPMVTGLGSAFVVEVKCKRTNRKK